MTHDPIDDAITDLEEGFRNLVDGLHGVIRVLRDENALLRARLDERRLITRAARIDEPAAVSPVVDVVIPTPPPAVQVVVEATPIVVEKPRRPKVQKLVTKTCISCGEDFVGTAYRRFCKPCFAKQAGDRLRKARETALHERFITAVDAHLDPGFEAAR